MKIKQATVDDADILSGLCSEIQGLHIKMQPLVFREPSKQELADLFRERISDPDYIAILAFNALGFKPQFLIMALEDGSKHKCMKGK